MSSPGPSLHPFAYDAFQQQALETIDRGSSLFVAAPTGAGKTVIADYAIEHTLQRNQRVIYTSPIKALSNQKFRDFSARHPDQVGIMTGDVTINPGAAVMIMTTEIYRNTLLENPKRLGTCAWVIFDEVHYLDDPQRGTVWEEAILFTPTHINLLALSATIPNVEQLASWIREVHKRPVEIIAEAKRPVPLHMLFQCQNKIFSGSEALKHQGYLNREDWFTLQHRHPRHRHPRHRRHATDDRWQVRPNRLEPLIRHLQEAQHLPCIFFTFGRRRAEDLAWDAARLPLITEPERVKLRALFDDLCARFQLTGDRTIEALSHLIDRGVAYHHAGMLPTVKEVVERCFVSRLIKCILTTETFALGINMPARSVIIDALKKRMGNQSQLLRSRQFLQMAGRAGRRGMDEAGFVYLRINPGNITFQDVMRVIHGPPESVLSRFNTAYATLLNLYRQHQRALLAIFPKTFYYYQTSGTRRDKGLALMERKLDFLQELGYLTSHGLTDKGEFASWLYGYELFLTELHADGLLEGLDPPSLAILLVSAAYEPRPGLRLSKPNRISRRLEKLCEKPLARIHHAERRFTMRPLSKAPCFQLAPAMEAWFHGAQFARLTKLCEVDEGEIVRYFRMTVQLLRQLMETPAADEKLRRTAGQALKRINRDVVDAEQQLRLG